MQDFHTDKHCYTTQYFLKDAISYLTFTVTNAEYNTHLQIPVIMKVCGVENNHKWNIVLSWEEVTHRVLVCCHSEFLYMNQMGESLLQVKNSIY